MSAVPAMLAELRDLRRTLAALASGLLNIVDMAHRQSAALNADNAEPTGSDWEELSSFILQETEFLVDGIGLVPSDER